jgi:hypothetical protein|tara:strand:- start:79 stop:801 length:723 start_codon:yes stop_codon:yes gene_type:complete
MAKKRRKRSKRYFTQITEMAINAYNNSDDQVVKDKVFNRFIYYPFDKLAENVIHTYKTYYFDVPYEDVKANVVAFLIEKIHKFNGENGRAFSYFTVVARNYLFNENNANYARMKSKEKVGAIDTSRNITNEVVAQNNKEAKSDFIDHFTKYIDYHLYTLFLKDRDRAIADSINELFKNRYDLYSYNKKALYILIRERTGVHTQYITKVVGKLKGIYVELYAEYTSNGHISIKYKLKDSNG